VIFKGSGWYVTDYGKGRSSASIGAKDADSQVGKSSEKPSETKSDKVKEKTIAKEE
jgi:predicted nucleic acid-binding Zn ribbon protein